MEPGDLSPKKRIILIILLVLIRLVILQILVESGRLEPGDPWNITNLDRIINNRIFREVEGLEPGNLSPKNLIKLIILILRRFVIFRILGDAGRLEPGDLSPLRNC